MHKALQFYTSMWPHSQCNVNRCYRLAPSWFKHINLNLNWNKVSKKTNWWSRENMKSKRTFLPGGWQTRTEEEVSEVWMLKGTYTSFIPAVPFVSLRRRMHWLECCEKEVWSRHDDHSHLANTGHMQFWDKLCNTCWVQYYTIPHLHLCSCTTSALHLNLCSG